MIRNAALLAAFVSSTAAASPLYDRYCLPCHGAAGDGRGPAADWLDPPPRDFTRGRYKWRSTPSGQAPTDDDLARTIRLGAPGTSMPAFEGILDAAQIAELVHDVIAYAPARFAGRRESVPIPPRRAQPATDTDAVWRAAGCPACHGDDGHGTEAPYDLTETPLRRAATPDQIYLTLATGLDGTAMPALPRTTEADQERIWALVDWIESRRHRTALQPLETVSVGRQQAPSIASGLLLAPQGTPPPGLPPAAVALQAAQCGRCHAKQEREWRASIHARAYSPGLVGQLVGVHPGVAADCRSCHSPLAEQATDLRLANDGVNCAGCHVRNFVRHGPPRRADSGLLAIPSYPKVVDEAYERSDLCLPCHQLGPALAVNSRPLLNTYREWLEGPYMARGVQCQHCHMPEREHSWRGIHDAEAVRQGLRVTLETIPGGVTATVTNVGAGHFLPTTSTPQIYVSLGDQELRIGRFVEWDGAWRERGDTRLAPGASAKLTTKRSAGSTRLRVVVAPDEYYERFYRQLLVGKPSPEARKALEVALERARASRYVLIDETVAVP